jgi:hypothetical protein
VVDVHASVSITEINHTAGQALNLAVVNAVNQPDVRLREGVRNECHDRVLRV